MTTHTPPDAATAEGGIVLLDGEEFYRIADSDRLPPFLMTIPSDTDLWMFVASNGGLTAGRADASGSLFPYETVDRLYDSARHTGPVTLIRAHRGGETVLWEPFRDAHLTAEPVQRNLYKNRVGNAVVFEEVHAELNLAFRYRWSACDEFGWVRAARLSNLGAAAAQVELLDGMRDVLPYGASLAMYQQQSCLVDAYKRCELDPATGLAIFSLSAGITDRAEAAEELRANIVWCTGLERPVFTLSEDAIHAFRAGGDVTASTLLTGRRGNLLAQAALTLAPLAHAEWHLVADARRGPVEIAALRERLRAHAGHSAAIEKALARAADRLRDFVASADGLQHTGRSVADMHHFANVLYNIMRGGVFVNGHQVPVADFADFLSTRHRAMAKRHAAWLAALGEWVRVDQLIESARNTGDAGLERLAHEYLPLHFGRRHGDPSRPWNRFSIRPKRPDGSPALYYEGNWRDIFQNWEALAESFPLYLPGMVAKFVNASTLDGFNPYRVTRDGVDWEVIEPESAWSYIGYWGDHQIVYLLRLLESLQRHDPEALSGMLDRAIFSYANVPYRIKPYADLLRDPHATIDFDAALHERIERRVADMGTDGKLVADVTGDVRHASLLEKLLVTALARLSNFVPGGGIWMNTQRPEWNDANNALAGNGVSTVTLCYLRAYLEFVRARLAERGPDPVALAPEVAEWARGIEAALRTHLPASTGGPVDDAGRKAVMDALGRVYSDYRARVHASGLSAAAAAPAKLLTDLIEVALAHVDHALSHSRRAGGLYHAYHVLGPLGGNAVELRPLHEMLEGQVAALSTGAMPPEEAVRVLDALFASRMYDPERASLMLYPERERPAFLEKNAVAPARAEGIELLRAMLAEGDATLVAADATGTVRFHPDLGRAPLLAARLDALAGQPRWATLAARDRGAVLDLYEEVFHHRAFTGRSGTMYGYEGIGCIYWHMVAKLLLAVQGHALAALESASPTAPALVAHYFRVRAGLGYEKSPARYGAFPTDPYSHTPRHAGAQQPGMTGQVKEEILTRFGELGIGVHGGVARFRPRLLRPEEFLGRAEVWRYVALDGESRELAVPARALAFTWCGTPVVYQLSDGPATLRVVLRGGAENSFPGDALDGAHTAQLLQRTGAIALIEVAVPRASLIGA